MRLSLHKFLHELQHRTRRGTVLSAGMAGESLLAAKRLLSRPTFLCPSDAGAHVEICGGRKAHSRSLDCARDDKLGASDIGRQCLRREANTGGKPAYACRSNATRGCNSNATCGGRPTPLASPLCHPSSARDDNGAMILPAVPAAEANTREAGIRLSLKRHTRL